MKEVRESPLAVCRNDRRNRSILTVNDRDYLAPYFFLFNFVIVFLRMKDINCRGIVIEIESFNLVI